jgi:murein DD-endopeptidase MepM/ murein hydrolase activator NlpD
MVGRIAVAVSLLVVTAVGASGAGLAPGRPTVRAATPATVGGYVPPLPDPLRVLRPFAPPSTPYGPGHLGVDLRAVPGEVVRSAGGGVVRFAGPVAGRGVVVVAHAGGISTEYEPVRPAVRAGARVRAGEPIGTVRGRHAGCPGVCMHWGARRGDSYVDPLALLRPLGPVVLLPWSRDG